MFTWFAFWFRLKFSNLSHFCFVQHFLRLNQSFFCRLNEMTMQGYQYYNISLWTDGVNLLLLCLFWLLVLPIALNAVVMELDILENILLSLCAVFSCGTTGVVFSNPTIAMWQESNVTNVCKHVRSNAVHHVLMTSTTGTSKTSQTDHASQ